jgi:predicted transcriptional regulator
MNIREEVDKALDGLPEDALEGVLEYIQFIMGSVEPSEEERMAIKRGREEFSKGEFVDWEDVKRK